MENQCTVSPEVIISVSSVQFKTTGSLLKAIDGTLLSNLDESSEHFDKKENVYNFDRDPDLFRHILNAYRIKEVHIPRNYCPFVFKKELQFWEIPLHMIAPCCWQYLYDSASTLEDLKIVMKEENNNKRIWKTNNQIVPEKNDVAMETRQKNEKEGPTNDGIKEENVSKVWLFLEEPAFSTAAKVNVEIYVIQRNALFVKEKEETSN